MSDSSDSTITPEMARRILSAGLRNLVKKIASGGTLNATEMGVLRSIAGRSNGTVTRAADLSELALALGVSRQTIHAWRKREGAPEPGSDGSHDVLAWREFARVNGLKSGVTHDNESLKARKLLAEIEDRELRVAQRKGLYTLVSEVEAEWHRRMASLKNLLYSKLTMELPPLCVGKSAIEILQLNRDALDSVLREAAESP